MECDVEWYRGNITKMPTGIISMLQRMMNKYPDKRITAGEALKEPLFNGAEKTEDLILTTDFIMKNKSAMNSKNNSNQKLT